MGGDVEEIGSRRGTRKRRGVALWAANVGEGDASRREIRKVDLVTTRDHPTGPAAAAGHRAKYSFYMVMHGISHGSRGLAMGTGRPPEIGTGGFIVAVNRGDRYPG